MSSTWDYASGPDEPTTCPSGATSMFDCPDHCYWCDDLRVCVLDWTDCLPPKEESGGIMTAVVPLLVLAIVLGTGAFWILRNGEGGTPQTVATVRDGFEASGPYRRGTYSEADDAPETELVPYPSSAPRPAAEGQRLLGGVGD